MKRETQVDENERYMLSPKGIALNAMLECGLIQEMNDRRFEGFWRIFNEDMVKSGYVDEQ